MNQKVIISKNLKEEIAITLSECEHDRIFVLTDETTLQKCWPTVKDFISLKEAKIITIGSTDSHKDIESLAYVWKALCDGNATRHSCLINLGGGMITDLGGFAASTFKRGINFINIPTTLLSMVDASVGGKTGINFNGLKNEVGVFNNSKCTILDTEFLNTSDSNNMLSGYAEMIKHGLISSKGNWSELLSYDIFSHDLNSLRRLIKKSVKVKENIVTHDPYEKGLRKALNFGHTFGHAFEAWSLQRSPILHGFAVAYGIVCELYLSTIKTGLDSTIMRQTVNYIKEHYGQLVFTCNDYDELISLMKHDKKNAAGHIYSALIHDIGDVRVNEELTTDDIKSALDFYREGE